MRVKMRLQTLIPHPLEDGSPNNSTLPIRVEFKITKRGKLKIKHGTKDQVVAVMLDMERAINNHGYMRAHIFMVENGKDGK